MRAVWSLVVVGAALVTAAPGCGRSGYQYVENDDLGVYARLPDDWAVYDEADLFPDASERELESNRANLWVRTFDAAADPSVEASQSPGFGDPTGLMVIRALGAQERDALNVSSMRGGGNPARDPIMMQSAGVTEDGTEVTVLLDEPVTFEGDFTGVHTVFAMSRGDRTVVFDRTAVRNAETTALAVFEVSCSEDCYFETHQDEIADLVDSWTIEEVQ
jgi:hypothetical protein